MDIENQWWVIAGTAYAMVLGGVIGYERELKDRPAGFRTHMLVAGAATLLIEIGELLMFDTRYRGSQFIQIDPLRLVEAVVSGVAFIGAGTIFAARSGRTVAGITTAASLFMVAIVGVAVGFGFYLLSLAITLLTLLVLTVLKLAERKKPAEKP
ncbi:MAG TPA: MgtC/SapB family protein [Tahibacter sp.]|uniref:MgtC/SapB family protein n=1 Tax=Tahibacter sp. TaxID=2056211 RepID=UPI002BA84729|nr:MgtC/SapB family protein [Tahibacter sp.]HSX61787.1 MgtC/SapB family protein [Tahibacter sp.]